MKTEKRLLVVIFLSAMYIGSVNSVQAQSVPFPNPGHEGLNVKDLGSFNLDDSKDLKVGLWLQDRVMYNYSNIPGPGGTTFDSTEYYDFFRQRFRAGLDIRLVDSAGVSKAGAYAQFEYRGGWGGSSPAQSDPRGSLPVNNPYNRLQPRGIRYGFVYYNHNEHFNLSVGILPLTDRVGRVLFDADWDLNVGGITIDGKCDKGNYRLAYVRLIDGVGHPTSYNIIGLNGSLYLLDYNYPFSESFEAGIHVYGLDAPTNLGVTLSRSEAWYGLSVKSKFDPVVLNGFFLMNNGEIAGEKHSGMALKLEAGVALGKAKFSLEGLYATGDEVDTLGNPEVSKRFVTLHQIVGTAGYWGYMHIFTPNGPSDVNDLGLEIGNGGAGLTTIQAKLDFPLIKDKLNGQVFGGWFQANKERNNSKNMGSEFGGMLTYSFAKHLNLEFGAAYAMINKFYGNDTDGLVEIFSRIQFTW